MLPDSNWFLTFKDRQALQQPKNNNLLRDGRRRNQIGGKFGKNQGEGLITSATGHQGGERPHYRYHETDTLPSLRHEIVELGWSPVKEERTSAQLHVVTKSAKRPGKKGFVRGTDRRGQGGGTEETDGERNEATLSDPLGNYGKDKNVKWPRNGRTQVRGGGLHRWKTANPFLPISNAEKGKSQKDSYRK